MIKRQKEKNRLSTAHQVNAAEYISKIIINY